MSNQIWPKDTIGGLFDIGAGKAMSPSARLGERTYPFLRTSNVFWGEVDLTKLDTMNYSEDEIEYKSLKKGDLLVCEGGDIGRSAIWHGQVEKCGFQNHIHRLRPKSEEVISAFFMYYLQAGFTQLGIYEGAGNKTTIPNLSRGRLAVLEVPKPPKSEQEKIAAILLKVQRAIQVEEKLATTARELKQSAMRQLFAQGLGVKTQKETDIGFIPISWEIKELSLVADFERKSPKQQAASKETPFIPMTLMPEEGLNITEWEMRTDEQIKSGVPVCDGDLLVAKITPCFENGKQGIVRGLPNGVGYATTEVIIIRSKGELLLEYLAYYLRQESVRSYLTSRMEGSTGRQRLPKSAIENLKIPFPPPHEQKEIAGILQTIDRKICIHERKHAALSDLFQTLLNQLMTAQIRVDKLDIDTREVTA